MQIERWTDINDHYRLTLDGITCSATVQRKERNVLLDFYPRGCFHPMHSISYDKLKEIGDQYTAMAQFLDAVIIGL